MVHDVSAALAEFTHRFINVWQNETGDFPYSEALYGVASPCVVRTENESLLESSVGDSSRRIKRYFPCFRYSIA